MRLFALFGALFRVCRRARDERGIRSRRLRPGTKHALELPLEGAARDWSLPILYVRGRAPGRRLVVTAAVHGDEFEGVRAILDLYEQLDPSHMSGDFLSVPVANPPAFWNKSRTSPVDGANLAREFPGSLDKNCTSAIAYSLGQSIIAHADFYLDLHSAGIHLNMPRLVGYDARDPRSRDARSLSARGFFGRTILQAAAYSVFRRANGNSLSLHRSARRRAY